MVGRRIERVLLIPLAVLALALPVASAGAEAHSYTKIGQLIPSQGGAVYGPANLFPSTITVAGLTGTVSTVTVTLIGMDSSSGDDIDAVLSGPNGQNVMLMSDACGVFGSFSTNNFTFDDAAPGFLPNNGTCLSNQDASFKPSNYLGNPPEPDDLSPSGGPAPPYVNAMSFLAGGSPNGDWSLFLLDDDDSAGVGFALPAWALNLDVQPAPAPEAKRSKAKRCKRKKKGGKRAAASKKRRRCGKKKKKK
jgi:hypothetical protein